MSNRSNDQGRAYEFTYLMVLFEEISKRRSVQIEKNKNYFTAEIAWYTLDIAQKERYRQSAIAGVDSLFDLEPLILENNEEEVILKIQSDNKGKEGDVRDLLIIKHGTQWEIGLSIKHNHFAVKHCRLSKSLDFGRQWYGINCSEQYWQEIKPVFDYLEVEKKKDSKWNDLPNKEEAVYVPLLNAFKNELERRSSCFGKDMMRKLTEYLLGKFDFYKVIGIDSIRTTRIQCFNLRGTLNQQGCNCKTNINVPTTVLPTRIVSLGYKLGSKNTLELRLDYGWQFSFRIHNASTKVETSLKFDIQIIKMPETVVSIDRQW